MGETGQQQRKGTVYLVDGTAQLFRAYYAIRGLTNDEGLPTNAVFGFTSMLRKLLVDESPHYIGVAWDLPGKTFRHDLDPEYKANRSETPEELNVQFPYAKQVCDAFCIPSIELENYEADDVIATLARKAHEDGHPVVIVASDKDLMQLVQDGIEMINPSKGLRLDSAGVKREFGVGPEYILDVQALMGDSVDNIPGVAGVGEKTAKAIVSRYGHLERILQHADAFTAFVQARDAWLEAWHGIEKIAELEEAGLSGCAETVDALTAAWDRLRESELDPEYAARLEEAREIFHGWWSEVEPLATTGASGKPLGKPTRPACKALKDLDKKSGKRQWLAIAGQPEEAIRSKELARLVVDAPIAFDPHDLVHETPDRDAAHRLFGELGFRRLMKEFADSSDDPEPESLPVPVTPPAEPVEEVGTERVVRGEYGTIYTREDLERAVENCRSAGSFAVDTETDSVDPMQARLVGISLSCKPGEGVYIPTGHTYLGAPDQLSLEVVQEILGPLLADGSVGKIAQNLKFDLHVLRRHGMPVEGWQLDTMVAAFLLQSDRHSYKMDVLSEEYLGYAPIPYEQIAGKGARQITMNLIDVERVSTYAAEDADVTLRLALTLQPRLVTAGLQELYDTVDGPLLPMLARMEARGIGIDVEMLAAMSTEIDKLLSEHRLKIHQLADTEFNVDSPKQLREVLFDKLGFKPRRKTAKSKVASTDHQTLEELAEEHEIAQVLLAYRELAKLKGTYVDALPKLVNPETGRVHTSYHPTGAATGRLSSSDPNLQNIPVRTEAGRRIREAFVPRPGYRFLASDYSQVELRVLAHLCGDPDLISAFRAGEDIHRHTAASVAGVPLREVDDIMRQRAKAVNFGILYGMSSTRLAREQGMTREEASAFIEAYFDRFGAVRTYIETIRELAMSEGAVRTLFGRVRYFPQLHQGVHRGLREQALRAAVNTTIQGTAADLMKMAMLQVEDALQAAKSPARILLQVHDELMLEVPEDSLDETERIVRDAMEGVYKLAVPLKVDQKVGQNWAEVK